MEHLSILEKKIGLLIENKKTNDQRIEEALLEIECLKEEKSKLAVQYDELKQIHSGIVEENEMLKLKAEKLEDSLLVRHQNIEMLNQERELTKMAVDDLIKDLDNAVGSEQSS